MPANVGSGFSRIVLLALCFVPRAASSADRIATAAGDILITPLIHASVQIEYGRTVIQVDPWSAGDLSAAKPADVILVTDDPVHHLDVAAIQKLKKPGATVIIPASGKTKVADGIVLANGSRIEVPGGTVEATPAYDLTPGEPYHPKGKANGYLIAIGGSRILVAGVTECVPEIRALRNIDVAFVPVNLPAGRMAPPAAADCVKALRPRVVYPYHYDQAYAAKASSAAIGLKSDPAAVTAADEFARALAGEKDVQVRIGPWYPAR